MSSERIPFPSIEFHRTARLEKMDLEIVLNRYEGGGESSEMQLTFIENLLEHLVLHCLATLKSRGHLLLGHAIGEACVKMGLAAKVLTYPRQHLSRHSGVDRTELVHEA